MSLAQIDFGRDTAEFDKRLSEYFLETQTYSRVLNGEKSIITGRKGSGKTALLKYCSETENASVKYILKIEASHSTYVKIDENLRSFTTQIKNLDASFKLGWLFTTLLALLDRLISETTMYVTKEERELYDFAKSNYHYDKTDPIAAIAGYIFSWIRNLKKIGDLEREPDAAAASIFDEPRILQLIRSAVRRINEKGKTVVLFFDKLDERWDASPLYINFLQGLFLAIKELKSVSGLAIHPVILLRNDIFDAVTEQFQHVDHFRMEIEPIIWEERSLMQLLSLRIRRSLEKKGDRLEKSSDEELWRIAFPADIPARKAAIPPYAYMIERTLLRPRDIILFANLARDVALKHRHEVVTPADLIEAETKYSQTKLRDLVAEVSYKFPNIDLMLKTFKRQTVGISLYDLRLLIIAAKDNIGSAPPWMSVEEDDIIKILYSVGFLSYTTKGGVLRGTRVVHSAVDQDPQNLFDQDRIYVSPIFRKALELRDH